MKRQHALFALGGLLLLLSTAGTVLTAYSIFETDLWRSSRFQFSRHWFGS
jgi:hypothetical protein